MVSVTFLTVSGEEFGPYGTKEEDSISLKIGCGIGFFAYQEQQFFEKRLVGLRLLLGQTTTTTTTTTTATVTLG